MSSSNNLVETMSMAEFISRLQSAKEAEPQFSDVLDANLLWAKRYDPFTPVILRDDPVTGRIIPSVDLSGMAMKINIEQPVEFSPITPDEETQAVVANLNILAQIIHDYELDHAPLIRHLSEELKLKDEATVRKELDEAGIGSSAKILRHAKETVRQLQKQKPR